MSRASSLNRLARLHGVATVYRDVDGRPKPASRDALTAVLRAMGVPLQRPQDVLDAERLALRERWDARVEPVHVAWDGSLTNLPVYLPAQERDARVSLDVYLEEGGRKTWTFALRDVPGTAEADVDGRHMVRLALSVPERLPLGIHEAILESRGATAATRILSSPGKAAGAPHGWGTFFPTYALRSDGGGQGDLGDLDRLVSHSKRFGSLFTGTLPLLPFSLHETGDVSPYAPVSRLFWNDFYVDLSNIPELDAVPNVLALLRSPALLAEKARMERCTTVPYAQLAAWKRRILAPLADFFFRHRDQRFESAQAFEADEETRRYARFRAEAEDRTAASEPERDPGERGVSLESRYHHHLYAQWLVGRQLREVSERARAGGGGLYLDFPLGVHPDGYDTHRHPELFARGVGVGAPPDALFGGGQHWGFPPLLPAAMRRDGYAYWKRALEHHISRSGLLRMDHVASLHRLFWIPEGMPPAEGVYVHYPTQELTALITLASRRANVPVVGEDLGLVPRTVRRTMARHGLLRLFVMPTAVRFGEIVPPKASLACLETHDMPPFAAWLKEDPNAAAALSSLLGAVGTACDVLRAALCHLAAGPQDLLLISLDDLYLGTKRHNTPGTPPSQNWRERMPMSMEALFSVPRVRDLLATIDHLRRSRA